MIASTPVLHEFVPTGDIFINKFIRSHVDAALSYRRRHSSALNAFPPAVSIRSSTISRGRANKHRRVAIQLNSKRLEQPRPSEVEGLASE